MASLSAMMQSRLDTDSVSQHLPYEHFVAGAPSPVKVESAYHELQGLCYSDLTMPN